MTTCSLMLSQDVDFQKGQGCRKASLSDSHKGGDTSKAIQWLLHMGCTGIYRSEGEQSTFAVVRHTQPMIHDQ